MFIFNNVKQEAQENITTEFVDVSQKQNSNTTCSVIGCDTHTRDKTASFFLFPKEYERRKDWMVRIGREDLLEKSYESLHDVKICSQHFEQRNKNFLGKQACPISVPTLFLSNSINYDKNEDTISSDTSKITGLECAINLNLEQKNNIKQEFVYEHKSTEVGEDKDFIVMSSEGMLSKSAATQQSVDNLLYSLEDECGMNSGIVIIPKYVDLKATCRTCLATNHLQSIFNESSDEKIKYSSMLQVCTSIQVSEADKLPQLICASCVQELTRLYYFTNICRRSEKTLTCYIQHVEQQKTTGDTVKQLVEVKEIETDQKVTSDIKNIQSKQTIDVLMEQWSKFERKPKKSKKKIKARKQITNNDETINFDSNKDNCENITNNIEENEQNTESDSILYSLLAASENVPTAEENTVESNVETATINEIISVDHDYTRQTADLVNLKATSISSASHVQRILCKKDPKTNQLEQVKMLGTKLLQNIDLMKYKIIKLQPKQPKKGSQKQQAHSIGRSKLKQYECEQCDKKFYTLVGRNRHRREEHMPEPTPTHGELESLAGGSISEPYKCGVCQKQFGNRGAYRTHLHIHQEPSFLCNECGKLFKVNQALQRHLRSHSGDLRHECTVCNRRWMTRSRLRMHMRIHTGEKPNLCPLCGKAFRTRTGLAVHERRHRGEKPYACTNCERRFAALSNLREHERVHMTIRDHLCMQCSRSFNTRARLLVHEQKMHTEGGFACNYQGCSVRFETSRALLLHSQIHARPYPCPLCPRAFVLERSVDIHVLREHAVCATDEQPGEPGQYRCPICDMQHEDLRELAQHDQLHAAAGDRSYSCVKCERTFSSEYTFELHADREHKPRPYECKECGKTFTAKSGLYIHKRLHTGERKHVCQHCERTFAQHQQLVYHMRVHTGERPHICTICGKGFALNGNLTVHMRRHTGDKPYSCELCGAAFYDSSHLRKHERAAHQNKPTS